MLGFCGERRQWSKGSCGLGPFGTLKGITLFGIVVPYGHRGFTVTWLSRMNERTHTPKVCSRTCSTVCPKTRRTLLVLAVNPLRLYFPLADCPLRVLKGTQHSARTLLVPPPTPTGVNDPVSDWLAWDAIRHLWWSRSDSPQRASLPSLIGVANKPRRENAQALS